MGAQLRDAARRGLELTASRLIAAKASVDSKDHDVRTLDTSLFKACCMPAARSQNDAGPVADPCWRGLHVMSQDGWTALMFAASNGHLAMSELLLRHGADVHARDSVRASKAVSNAVVELETRTGWRHGACAR
jgi:hypothetical protein